MSNALSTTIIDIAGATIPLMRGGEGQPLLFLNGGDAFHMSDRFLRLLAAKYRIYVPKHPGYADAPSVEHIRTVNDLALFYLELLDHLKLADCIVVGASFGGWVALEVAIRSCARISEIVLIDSVGVKFGGPSDADIADIYTLRPEVLRKLQYANAEACVPDYSAMSDVAARAVIEDRTGEALYGWRPYMHNPVLRHWLRRIRCPALVLWGEQDGIVSPDYGRRLCAELPHGEFKIVDGAGHFAHIEKPEAVVDHLVQFTSRH